MIVLIRPIASTAPEVSPWMACTRRAMSSVAFAVSWASSGQVGLVLDVLRPLGQQLVGEGVDAGLQILRTLGHVGQLPEREQADGDGDDARHRDGGEHLDAQRDGQEPGGEREPHGTPRESTNGGQPRVSAVIFRLDPRRGTRTRVSGLPWAHRLVRPSAPPCPSARLRLHATCRSGAVHLAATADAEGHS
jgi:hypothetical protein